MECTVTFSTTSHATSTASAAPEEGDYQSLLLVKIADYWRELGLTHEPLITSLSEDCLSRARRLVGRVSLPELLRRSLEEAQRRFDHALAAAIGMPPSNDPYPLAAARAAMLLNPGCSADSLFTHDEETRKLKEYLERNLPQSTPEESVLPMTPVPFRFWLFKSTDS